MATLTAAAAKRIKRPGRHPMGQGVYVLVKDTGSRSWVARIQVDGRRVDRGLGSLEDVTLAQARRKAAEIRAELRDGTIPAARDGRVPTRIPTLREAAHRLHENRRVGWRSAEHTAEWLESLERHVFPALGDWRLDKITRKDCIAVLRPLYGRIPATANRLKQRLWRTFRTAQRDGLIASNPADLDRDDLPIPAPHTAHFKALAHEEVAEGLGRLWRGSSNGDTKLAIAFTVLTAARSGEVRGATWAEISDDWRTWEIPAVPHEGRGTPPCAPQPPSAAHLGAGMAKRVYDPVCGRRAPLDRYPQAVRPALSRQPGEAS